MALHIEYLRKEEPVAVTRVDRYWYLTEDKTRVVEEGDPAGRWLWASPGDEVPEVDAVRLGAVQGDPAPEPEPEPEPEHAAPDAEKATPPPGNKQRTKPGDKAAPAAKTVDELRQQAQAAGVKVDNRWGEDRLRAEIDKANG